MSKTAVIHQPDFLSYLGFFHRLLDADVFVLLDDVQFVSGTSRSWTNRDKIKTAYGEKWLTVAVRKCAVDTKINEVLLSDNADWRVANLNLLTENYRKATYFDEVFMHVEKLYNFECEKLLDFSLKSIHMLLELFDIDIETMLSSSFNTEGKGNEMLVDILKKVKADTYLSGVGAKDYHEPKPFENAGIKVSWQDFKHPEYPQLYGEFIPYLSSIDLLFNCGIENSREIIRNN